MKKPLLVPLTALAIGIAASFAAYNIINAIHVRSLPMGQFSVIGEIQSIKGDVDRKLPQSVKTEPVLGPSDFYSQETIFTQGDSRAIVSFKVGTTLRLTENTRLVAEIDSGKKGAVIATLLDGSVNILNTGRPGLFRLFQNGREVALTTVNEKPMVAMIPTVSLPQSGSEPGSGLVIRATQGPEEEATVPSTESSRVSVSSEPNSAASSSDVLTNDDIVRQLHTQTGFFQRCYLTYLHRTRATTKPKDGGGEASSIGPTGTIVTSFRILPSGKVSEMKIARSDFNDGVLNRCVGEVIERTRFHAFQGVAIAIQEFPITLH